MDDRQQLYSDIAAFGIIECGVQLSYEQFIELCANDQLWLSLVHRWQEKQEREDRRVALICHVINRSQGGKMTIEDFMPKKNPTRAEIGAGMVRQILQYDAIQRHKSGVK